MHKKHLINKIEEEKIKALKIAFITEELNLTSNEAEKFWPVYNKYDEILHRLERVERYKIKTKIKKLGGVSSLSEKEAKSLIKQTVKFRNRSS